MEIKNVPHHQPEKTMKNPSLQNKLAHSATDPIRSDPTFTIAFVPNTTTLSRNQRFQKTFPPRTKHASYS